MRTLVLSPRYTDDSNAMWRAATARGWDVVRVRSYKGDAIDADVSKHGPFIYGETLLADALAEPLGITVIEPSPQWLPELPEMYRKRPVRLATLGEARRLSAPTFVKPVDEKIFKSRVYQDGGLIDPDFALDDSELVHISDVVHFELEVRLFVANRRAHTYSAYLRNGALAKNEAGEWPLGDDEAKQAMRFANGLLMDQKVDLPDALVIDIGRTSDRGWCVVEANPCWCSGLCGCDPRAALEVCAAASKPKAEEAKWTRRPKG